jgi:hypothetical protein
MKYEYKIVYKKGSREEDQTISSKDGAIIQARILSRLMIPVKVYELEYNGKELKRKRLIFENTEE